MSPSFRIAGGSLIVLIAWSMLQGKLGEVRHNKEEKGDTLAKESIAVVPLALPLMAGPGAISSTIVYASQFDSASQLLGMSLVVVEKVSGNLETGYVLTGITSDAVPTSGSGGYPLGMMWWLKMGAVRLLRTLTL